MSQIVKQHSALLQPNLAAQFKRLVLLRLLTENLFVFLLQYSGLKLSNLSGSPSPLWFASGTACAFLFLRGYSILPGLFLGSFFAYYLATLNFYLSFSAAFLLAIQALLLLWFSYKYLSPTLIFYRLKPYMQFILFTAVLTALTSALLLFICTEPKATLFLQWWLGNLNGIIIFACALVTWDSYFPGSFSLKQVKGSLVTSYALLALISVVLVLSTNPVAVFFLALANLMISLWISTQLGWNGAITAAFLSGLILSLAAFLETPIFNTSFILFLQVFLCVEATMGLGLSQLRHPELREG